MSIQSYQISRLISTYYVNLFLSLLASTPISHYKSLTAAIILPSICSGPDTIFTRYDTIRQNIVNLSAVATTVMLGNRGTYRCHKSFLVTMQAVSRSKQVSVRATAQRMGRHPLRCPFCFRICDLSGSTSVLSPSGTLFFPPVRPKSISRAFRPSYNCIQH